MWQEHVQQHFQDKVRRALTDLSNALFTDSGLLAYTPIILVTIFMFCIASWLVFLPINDAARYQCYALSFWLGGNSITHVLPGTQCDFLRDMAAQPFSQPPFHILPIEYPPLTLVPFSLALLVPVAYYQLAFALLMALTSFLIYWLLLRFGPRRSALIYALYILIGAVAVAQTRFDLLPAALTLLCVIAADHKRWTAAYVALAFGILLKIYPVLLLPALFVAEQQTKGRLRVPEQSPSLKATFQYIRSTLREFRQWEWKNSAICLGILIGITGGFALLDYQGAVVSQFNYFLQRPIQIESVGSSILWLANHLGDPQHFVYTYGSLNVISNLSRVVSFISMGFFLCGYMYIFWLLWRKKVDFTQATIALLLIFIATGKVFSPQYLIWLIPLLAYAGTCDMFWLICWGGTSILTMFIYTFLYARLSRPELIQFIPGFFESVGIRNAFFLLATLAYLFNWFHVRQRKPLPVVVAAKKTRPL